MKRDFTSGSIPKTVIAFALPYMLSYFLQTLYGMADLFIMGQFGGVDSITAVSNGSQVMYMITVILVGLAMGTTVMIGRAVGARKPDEAAAAIGNTATLFLGLSLVLTVLLLGLVQPIVRLIGTPTEAIDGTVRYLRICFVGIPFITAYNVISAIFRGMGDSKTPMYVIGIACVTNILLDYLFIGAMHMGPAGAAWGTTLSQTLSVLIALFAIHRKGLGLPLQKKHFHPKKTIVKQLLKVGAPVAVQDGCVQVAFMIITVIVNYRGLNDAAAVGIVEKLISALFIVPSSMLATVSALSAQNLGAGKSERAIQTLRCAICITVSYGVLITVLIEWMPQAILGLFTSDSAVIDLGCQYLRGYVLDTIFAGVHFSFSGYFAACGKSYIGFLHNILSISLVRIPGSYWMSKLYSNTLFPMGLCAPLGSVLSVIICVAVFFILKRRVKNT